MKKSIGQLAILFLLIISWSCVVYSWKKTPIQGVEPEKRDEVKISAVQVLSGEKTELIKKPAGRIQEDSVVGEKILKNFVLEKSKIKHPESLKTGAPDEITTTDGVIYTANRILSQTASNVTFDGYVRISIPLTDVDLVWIRKVNLLATLLLDIGPIIVFEVIESLSWSHRKE